MGKWWVIVASVKGEVPLWINDASNKGFEAENHLDALRKTISEFKDSPNNIIVGDSYWFVGVGPFNEKGIFWGDDTVVASSHIEALERVRDAWILWKKGITPEELFSFISDGHIPEAEPGSLWEPGAIFEKGLAR